MTRRKLAISLVKTEGASSAPGRSPVRLPAELYARAKSAYQTMIEQLPAATHLSHLDQTSSTIFISPQIEEMTGFRPDEWIADPDLWTKLLHPDDRGRVVAANAQHIATGEPFREEYRFVAADGHIVWVKEEARILRDENGSPIASQGIILDCTDYRRVEHELRQSLEVRRDLTSKLARAKAESGIEALIAALCARDGYTGEHCQAVVDLVEHVAERLGLTTDEVKHARQVALLHDIGKMGVPDSILRKRGPLDAHQWRVMREHPIIGARIVESIPGLEQLAPAIRAEHERWDGNGYPDGLAGEAIPLASRIVFVCDAYHAMISNRPYRRAMSEPSARLELRRKAGSQFDTAAVNALLAILEEERPPAAGPLQFDEPPIRVLLVDDDASIRMLLRFTLESEGTFEICGEAGDGSEALAMVQAAQPDAVVIDLAMPIMGGLQAIPRIRQLSPATKVVVFTASDSPDVLNDAMRSGADVCLGKGASLTEVSGILGTLCTDQKANKEHHQASV
jgi:PAS domain S-box-containing protein/putative nucleotidyltransferase with HDIG domain